MSVPLARLHEDRTYASAQVFHRVRVHLMAHAVGAANDRAFATMIASQVAGAGALPPWLGLEPAAYRCLLDHHFPGARPSLKEAPVSHGSEPGDGATAGGTATRGHPGQREEERADLVRLLLMHRAGDSPSLGWMAQVVAAACMGGDHLWQDLGLLDRGELNALMRNNFPSLAARNVKDMKWKRFLYKQLCEAEGIHACRAPSCEVCTDYPVCFGPDD